MSHLNIFQVVDSIRRPFASPHIKVLGGNNDVDVKRAGIVERFHQDFQYGQQLTLVPEATSRDVEHAVRRYDNRESFRCRHETNVFPLRTTLLQLPFQICRLVSFERHYTFDGEIDGDNIAANIDARWLQLRLCKNESRRKIIRGAHL